METCSKAKNFVIQEVAYLQFAYWPRSAFDGNWCRLGCFRLRGWFLATFVSVLRSTERKTLMLYEWKVLVLALCFRWDDWERKKIVIFLEDPNMSTWNTYMHTKSLPFTCAIVCCLPVLWYFITLFCMLAIACSWHCDEASCRWKAAAIPLNEVRAISWGRDVQERV